MSSSSSSSSKQFINLAAEYIAQREAGARALLVGRGGTGVDEATLCQSLNDRSFDEHESFVIVALPNSVRNDAAEFVATYVPPKATRACSATRACPSGFVDSCSLPEPLEQKSNADNATSGPSRQRVCLYPPPPPPPPPSSSSQSNTQSPSPKIPGVSLTELVNRAVQHFDGQAWGTLIDFSLIGSAQCTPRLFRTDLGAVLANSVPAMTAAQLKQFRGTLTAEAEQADKIDQEQQSSIDASDNNNVGVVCPPCPTGAVDTSIPTWALASLIALGALLLVAVVVIVALLASNKRSGRAGLSHVAAAGSPAMLAASQNRS